MSLLQAAIMSQISADQPNEFALYQPFEDRQIVLNESAQCLSVQTFMLMNKIDAKVIYRSNVEYMSPCGKVPMLKCGNLCISKPNAIFKFLQQKGACQENMLKEQDAVDLKAYTELVENVLTPAELYIAWLEDDTYLKITKKRYGSPYKWPLNLILSWRKRKEILYYLDLIGWKKDIKSKTKLLEDVESCCAAFSQKLGDNPYFFGELPGELDALVFGHLFTILTTRLPDNRLAETVRKFENLIKFCQRIDTQYFAEKQSVNFSIKI